MAGYEILEAKGWEEKEGSASSLSSTCMESWVIENEKIWLIADGIIISNFQLFNKDFSFLVIIYGKEDSI